MALKRGTWVCVWNPKTGKTDFIPKGEYVRPYAPKSVQVMSDLQPYRNVIDGKVIGGRRQHREFLRANNCIEVGNEKQSPRPAPSNQRDPALVGEIKRAMGLL